MESKRGDKKTAGPVKRRAMAPAATPRDVEARKRAAAVLEVLGGLSSPGEAASAVGMSLAGYYILEKRALEGLAAACVPAGGKGRQPSPVLEIARLREQVKGLEREASRNLAMARAARRAAGLVAPSLTARPAKESAKEGGKKRKKRRPAVRALLAAEALRGAAAVETAVAAEPVAAVPALPSKPPSAPSMSIVAPSSSAPLAMAAPS